MLSLESYGFLEHVLKVGTLVSEEERRVNTKKKGSSILPEDTMCEFDAMGRWSPLHLY